MDPPIEVILNAHSGGQKGQERRQALEELFRAAGRSATVLIASEGGLTQLAAKCARSGSEIVVAAGGDGTIACVAATLVGSGKTLGVIPIGTLNHFSKDLGIPQEQVEAVRVILEGRTIQVDVGEVNGRVFLNNSSLGIYPVMVSDRVAQQHRFGRGKWWAFLRATLNTLRRYPLLQVHITAANKTLSRRTPSVFVGNNLYTFTGRNLGTRSTLQGAKLGIYVNPDTGRLGLFGLLGRALFGRLDPGKDFDAVSAEEAWIETHKRHLLVATDGEVTPMASPLHYRIRPGALRVRVPHPGKPT